MKTIKITIALSLLLLGSKSWGQVTVYEHNNYGGKSHTYTEGEHHLTPTIGDNVLSSVKVSSGWKATIQEHGPGRTDRGKSIVLTSDANELASKNFNDIGSTIIVERVDSTNTLNAGKTLKENSTSLTNIAKGKTCRASSVNYGGAASRAVDGNTNGVYSGNSCTHSNDENDPWWEIDLGDNYDVSKIVIWNRTDDCCWNRLQGFYVMASEHPITTNSTEGQFQFISGGALSFNNGSQSSMTLEGNKKCRYIRIFIPGSIKILSLAEVEIFGQPSKAQTSSTNSSATSLPDKFKVLAFSVNQGKQEQDKYWFATNNGGSRGTILSTSKLINGSKWMEIQRIDLGNNIFVFKVLNAGTDMYLTAKDNKEVHIEKAVEAKIPEGAKFKTVVALTSAKGANENNYRSFESVKFSGHYLRHKGYVLFVHPTDNTELFKQDASWLIEKM